jgi:hypothetical protein
MTEQEQERLQNRIEVKATLKRKIKQSDTDPEQRDDLIAEALAEFFVGQAELRAEIAGLTTAITDAAKVMAEWGKQVEAQRRSFT